LIGVRFIWELIKECNSTVCCENYSLRSFDHDA